MICSEAISTGLGSKMPQKMHKRREGNQCTHCQSTTSRAAMPCRSENLFHSCKIRSSDHERLACRFLFRELRSSIERWRLPSPRLPENCSTPRVPAQCCSLASPEYPDVHYCRHRGRHTFCLQLRSNQCKWSEWQLSPPCQR